MLAGSEEVSAACASCGCSANSRQIAIAIAKQAAFAAWKTARVCMAPLLGVIMPTIFGMVAPFGNRWAGYDGL